MNTVLPFVLTLWRWRWRGSIRNLSSLAWLPCYFACFLPCCLTASSFSHLKQTFLLVNIALAVDKQYHENCDQDQVSTIRQTKNPSSTHAWDMRGYLSHPQILGRFSYIRGFSPSSTGRPRVVSDGSLPTLWMVWNVISYRSMLETRLDLSQNAVKSNFRRTDHDPRSSRLPSKFSSICSNDLGMTPHCVLILYAPPEPFTPHGRIISAQRQYTDISVMLQPSWYI